MIRQIMALASFALVIVPVVSATSVAAQSLTLALGAQELEATATTGDVSLVSDLVRSVDAASVTLVIPPDMTTTDVDQVSRELGLPRLSVRMEGSEGEMPEVQIRVQGAAFEVHLRNLSAEATAEILSSFPVQEVVVSIDDSVVASRVFALQSTLVAGGAARVVVRQGAG